MEQFNQKTEALKSNIRGLCNRSQLPVSLLEGVLCEILCEVRTVKAEQLTAELEKALAEVEKVKEETQTDVEKDGDDDGSIRD